MKNKDLLEKLGVKFTLQEAINFKNNLSKCYGVSIDHRKRLIEKAEKVISIKENIK